MKQEIKTALVTAAAVTVAGSLVGFVGWDVLVDKYLVGHIQKKLEEDNYLREEIREGQFVSTDRKAFSENHEIKAENLLNLKEGNLATTKSVKSHIDGMSQEFDDHVDVLGAKLELRKSEIEEFESRLQDALVRIRILEAKQDGAKLTLEVYINSDSDKQGILTLNEDNETVSSLIGNNKHYDVRSSEKENRERYRVRLEPLSVGKDKEGPFANLYIDDFHRLFEGERKKRGDAFKAVLMVPPQGKEEDPSGER